MRETQTKSDPLQQNNQTISEFVRRTEELADRTGLNLSELPRILGFSKPMLFAYRSGKNRITSKVWLKLERAEREASKESPPSETDGGFVKRETNLNESELADLKKFSGIVREDETPYRFTPMAPQCQGHEPNEEGLRPVLERIAKALERLVEIEDSRNPKP